MSNQYASIKKHNPDLPLLVREAKDTPARVFARFGACIPAGLLGALAEGTAERGVERHVEVDGLSAEEVDKAVSTLVASQ